MAAMKVLSFIIFLPACELSGSTDDPINQRTPIAPLEKQKKVLPQQNLKWVCHFKKACFIDNDDVVALKARVHNKLFEQAAVQCLIGYLFLRQYTDSRGAELAQIRPSFINFDVNLKEEYRLSRLKIFTLGGRLNGPEVDQAVKCLRILWHGVLAVPENQRDDQDLPQRYYSVAVTQFNFELWPGTKPPVPQIYLSTN
ncbi:hypothetical protein AAE478_003663 [Parahypoxylon ruwenzoriense]